MAKTQLSASGVAKSIDRSAAPICILDVQRHVRYINPKFANWLALDAKDAVGAKCFYTSEVLSNGNEDRLSGICPPPEIFDLKEGPDQINDFWVHSKANSSWRRASAYRISETNDSDPLILIIASSSQEMQAADTETKINALHNSLKKLNAKSKLSFPLNSLIGTSDTVHRLRRQVNALIHSQSDVLIVGEKGTGRQHLARVIDANRNDNFSNSTTIDCSIADQQMIQSIIGDALSQSKQRRPKRRESQTASDTGSLLLLDIHLLAESAQAELLGFLKLPEFPLRLIATSIRSNLELAKEERFHPELANYIETSNIKLLPLRERPEDIPLFAQAFVERANKTRVKQLAGLAAATHRLIGEYTWPGNLDELESTISEACLDAQSSHLEPMDLPKRFHDSISALRIGSTLDKSIVLDEYLESIERELVLRAIQQANGNKSRAAKLLNISRAKLLRRIQHLKIQPETTFKSEEKEKIEPSAFEEID